MASITTYFSDQARHFVRWLTSFFSVEGKMRANAGNWLELAAKVVNFRRDELKDSERAELQQKSESLRSLLRGGADASKLKLGIEALEGILRRTGGKIYPQSTMQEYVEFFLVAAILVLGVRVYFIQPFKIPTNSMWPSYNGMTPYVYHDPASAPGPVAKVVRLLTFGAVHQEVVAPADGKIAVAIRVGSGGEIAFSSVPGRKWWVFPAKVWEYVIYVGEEPVRVQVPEDFKLDQVLRETFGVTGEQLDSLARKSRRGDYNFRWVTIDREIKKGQSLLSFDVLTGDNLFVDRISYHFFQPSVGDGFVFRTNHIGGIGRDQYYIKRLVGVPGDKIEIREPVLYRNGKPITGAAAFDKNARCEGSYGGYRNVGMLESGQVVTVPEDGFLALGDNSANSADGRYWGYVPRKDVVGRPMFIYYPFADHWGPAR